MKSELKTEMGIIRPGTLIRIIRMDDDKGRDTQAHDYNGRQGEVSFIDDASLIHGTWGGLALIAGLDRFEIIKS